MNYINTNIFATGIFRNLNDEQKKSIIKDFNDKFDLHFNIISHGIENYYLGKAMDNDYQNKKIVPILKEYSAKKYGRKREFVDAEMSARLGIGIDETVLPETPTEQTPTEQQVTPPQEQQVTPPQEQQQ